jgi:exodeoxyribonuclease VII large subunit
LKAKLEAEGCFDAGRKRAIPRMPRRIGIVTSTAAAALHDVVTALQRRAPHVQVILYPALVQGAEAPASLVAALGLASRRAEVDTLLLCRGGGSLEDLWAFNDEAVARAVMACSMPVICGVGHETDVTIADGVADLRAPTPTAAAELCAPETQELMLGLAAWAEALQRVVARALDQAAQRVDRVSLKLQRAQPGLAKQNQRLSLLAQRLQGLVREVPRRQGVGLGHLQQRLQTAVSRQTERRQQQLAVLAARLQAMDPHQVLQRGYAVLRDEQGRVLPSAQGVEAGQLVQVQLADGELQAKVIQKTYT